MNERQSLIDIAFQSDDLQLICEAATRVLNNPVLLITPSYRIMAYTKGREVKDEIWLNAAQRGFITLEFGATLSNWNSLCERKGLLEYIDVTEISQYKRRFFKLHYQNQFVGYINVLEMDEKFEAISESDFQLVIEIMAKEMHINEKYHREKLPNDEFLLSLVHGDYVNRMHFNEMLRRTTLKETSYVIAMIDMTAHYDYNAGPDKLREELRTIFPNSTIAIRDTHMIMLVEEKYIGPLDDKKINYMKQHNFKLGISWPFDDLFQISVPLEQAMYTLKHTDSIEGHYEEFAVYHLLSKIENREMMVDTRIQEIAKYDDLHHTDYVNTLYMYYVHQGNIIETSDAMFVHRNTINYRISQLEEKFAIPFSDANAIPSLFISCMIIRGKKLNYFLDNKR